MGGPVQRLLAWATRPGVAAPAFSTFGVHGWPRLLATYENSSSLHSILSASGSNWICSSSRSTSSASSSSSSADAGQALGQEASSLGRKQRIVFLGTPQVRPNTPVLHAANWQAGPFCMGRQFGPAATV